MYPLTIRPLETDRKLKKIKNYYIWLCFNNYRGTLIDASSNINPAIFRNEPMA